MHSFAVYPWHLRLEAVYPAARICAAVRRCPSAAMNCACCVCICAICACCARSTSLISAFSATSAATMYGSCSAARSHQGPTRAATLRPRAAFRFASSDCSGALMVAATEGGGEGGEVAIG